MRESDYLDLEEEMEAAKMRSSFRRYALIAVVLGVLAFAFVGAWSYFTSKQKTQRQGYTAQYLTALQTMEHLLDDPQKSDPQTFDATLRTFEQLENAHDEGVSSLSKLYVGDLFSRMNKRDQALQQWRSLRDDSKADPYMREMASFLWCQRQLDDGDIPTIRSQLLLLESKNPLWKGPVLEALVVLDLREGNQHAAREKLSQVLAMPSIAPGVRDRSQKLLQTLAL